MSQRRMFSPKIVDSDAFLDMPISSQLIYFHLSMRADDDGFVGNPKKILRMVGGNEDDLKVLILKRFILTFETGVIVIKHWKIHNLIRADRYRETQYLDEKASLVEKENGSYTELVENVIPNGNQLAAQVKLSKGKLVEDRGDTPAEIARSFFSFEEHYRTIHDQLAEKIEVNLLEKELEKFILYWTEPNKSGTKVRWEQESTFDVRRRIARWFSNIKEYGTTRGRGIA